MNIPDTPLSAASLFSGGGLADAGLEEAGFEVVSACEIDRKARAVYRRHFPRAVIHHNIKELRGHDIPPVDVLFFGSPCQDLSVAGGRAGLAGARSGLFFEAMRVVDEMDSPPPAAIWENVGGALSSNEGRDFGTVLREMARRWSGIAYRILDLQFFGVPQRRRRVFVVGHSGGWERAAAILFEPEGLRWNPPTRGTARKGVARAITGSARGCDRGDGEDNLVAFGGNNTSRPVEVAARLGCNETGSGYRLDFESDTLITHSLRGEGFDASEDGTGRGTPLVPICFDTTQVTSRANYSNPKAGDPCHPLAAGAHAPAIAFPGNLSGTQCASTSDLSPALGATNPVAVSLRGRAGGGTAELSGECCPSMRASKGGGDKPHVLAMRAVRRLMPVECERLMGLEDGYTAWGIDDDGRRIELADSPRYKIIGNGVGKPHTRWMGRRLAADLYGCRRAGLRVASA